MKLPYPKPARFPAWGIYKSAPQKSVYKTDGNGVYADFTNPDTLPHINHIETTGFGASTILTYKINKDRTFNLFRFAVFPSLRVLPNNTRGNLTYKFKGVHFREKEIVNKVSFDGIITFESSIGDVFVLRKYCASADKKAVIEKITLTNNGDDTTIHIKNYNRIDTVSGIYTPNGDVYKVYTDVYITPSENLNGKKLSLKKGQAVSIRISYGCDMLNRDEIDEQFTKREDFIVSSKERLKITTPDTEINKLIDFCKVRSNESIFETKNGLMHCPGGGGFYGALWTNDQCEYANPYFAYLGYDKAIEQSYNCYRLYSAFADENKPIPTSIVALGDDIWNGAGDRGDGSMYLYGLSRFLLTVGDKSKFEEYREAVEKITKYVISKINCHNIVESDSDELENRFESGKANLSTSSITYDAFLSLSYLYEELGDIETANMYKDYADKIKDGIENYFGATVEGFQTYRYCEEEPNLRAWICLPLTVGIFTRKEETVKALLSDKLRKNEGVLTKSGTKTFWDRTTLYTLKGLFCAGESEKALELLEVYTKKRLLGEHVPYPVEAFPEGNAAQLSAESALYIRIFIEGILGFRPVGFGKFTLTPNLPEKWDSVTVDNLFVGGKDLSVTVTKEKITVNGKDFESGITINTEEL